MQNRQHLVSSAFIYDAILCTESTAVAVCRNLRRNASLQSKDSKILTCQQSTKVVCQNELTESSGMIHKTRLKKVALTPFTALKQGSLMMLYFAESAFMTQYLVQSRKNR